jgi:hypothetical protein
METFTLSLSIVIIIEVLVLENLFRVGKATAAVRQ